MPGLPAVPLGPPGRDLPLVRAAAADRRGRGVPVLPARAPGPPGPWGSGPGHRRPRVRAQPRGAAGSLDELAGYGQARGWAPDTLRRARRAVTAVLASGEDLGQPPWDAARLRRFLNDRHLVALRAIEFLTDQGLARGNPQAAFDQWLAARLAALPAPVAAEVRTWAEALQGRGPRAGPRPADQHHPGIPAHPARPAGQLGRAVCVAAQVTTGDLTAELTVLTGATRLLALSAMRSLFGTLKARRVLFTNPAAPLTGRQVQPPPVLPLEDGLRAGLLGRLHDPAERLIVLLAGVHALRPAGICALTLDDADPAAGTLLVSGRARPLDRLTAENLRAWLQARRARWPATANPHLLINRSTGGGLGPVSRSYIQAAVRGPASPRRTCAPTGSSAEAQASGGDPLRLTHLFGDQRPHRHPLLRRGGPARPDRPRAPMNQQQATLASPMSHGDSTLPDAVHPPILDRLPRREHAGGAPGPSPVQPTGGGRSHAPHDRQPRTRKRRGRQAGAGRRGTPRPPRQYHPGRGRRVENTIMSALVRAGLVPRSYLLTTRGRRTGRPRTNPVVPVEHEADGGWSHPTGPCPGSATPGPPGGSA